MNAPSLLERTAFRRWPRRARWAMAVLAALLVGAAALLLFWGELGLGTDAALTRIRQSGRLRVGLDPSFPPFENLNLETGEVVGYDADLARLLAQQLGEGVTPEWVIIGFDGLYDALWARKADVLISALPVDPMLTEDVAYSQPYFDAGLRLLRQLSSGATPDRAYLAGRRLGVEWGSEGDLVGRRLQGEMADLEIVTYLTAQEALAALRGGEVDALLLEGVAAIQAALADSRLELFGEIQSSQPYAVAMHAKDRGLQRAVNAAMRTLQAAGTLAELEARWMGPPVTPP
ncbi:MAG: amino acid ABC transporter substrate-binding protein [Chloroflexi bacterium]|nr:amino acid ABC transporter substrate-binding protein [Chloroflexota bacterium]